MSAPGSCHGGMARTKDMRSVFQFASKSKRKIGGPWWARSPKALFFLRFLADPRALGSVTPSSMALGRLIAKQIRRDDHEFVLELGAGTGAVTRALLDAGVPAEKLIVVEIDKQMARMLREAYPETTVVEGSAFELRDVLPEAVIGRIGTVVCGMPVSIMSLEQQRALAGLILSLMPDGRRFLQYSYRRTSPLPADRIGLRAERLAFTVQNIPPASVWGYGASRIR